tara:strand:- start:140 stop:766 length:627 start_codon:yes stop_codon:yes gene_type:complete
MAAKMPTIGAGRYGFLGLETKAGTESRIADQQLKRAQKDPRKLGASQAAQQAAIAQKMAGTRADIQAQQEALAASALAGTGTQAGALQQAATGLGETLGEARAGFSADVAAQNETRIASELQRKEDNAAEARAAKLEADQRLIEGGSKVLGVAGALIGGPLVGGTVSEISKSIGGIKPGTSDDDDDDDDDEAYGGGILGAIAQRKAGE